MKTSKQNEVGGEVLWALGDGDVDFALGDGLEDVVDGLFLLVGHRQGWSRMGLTSVTTPTPVLAGFNIKVERPMDAGPRFYVRELLRIGSAN